MTALLEATDAKIEFQVNQADSAQSKEDYEQAAESEIELRKR